MKTLLTWLTKGSKIRKILIYIFRIVFTVKAAAVAAIEAYKEVKPEASDKLQKLEDILAYLDVAADGVQTVLEWLGVSTKEIEDAKAEPLTVEAAKTEVAKTIEK